MFVLGLVLMSVTSVFGADMLATLRNHHASKIADLIETAGLADVIKASRE